MNIRNKFAHIKEVDSFEEFFKVYKDSNAIIKKLDSWYSSEIEFKVTDDEKYKFYFFRLVKDICIFLLDIVFRKMEERKKEEYKGKFNEIILKNLREEVLKQEFGDSILNKVLEISKIEFDNDSSNR